MTKDGAANSVIISPLKKGTFHIKINIPTRGETMGCISEGRRGLYTGEGGGGKERGVKLCGLSP